MTDVKIQIAYITKVKSVFSVKDCDDLKDKAIVILE